MEGGVLSEVALPLAIFLIMVAVGMALTVDDFRRVAATPRAVAAGLTSQLVLLPLLGFATAAAFELEEVFAVSIVLLAASPGGSTSNLVVHTADADRALSVTLTALSNMVVWLTMPFLLRAAFDVFGDGSRTVEVPIVQTMAQVLVLTVVPVLIGMFVRRRRPQFSLRVEGPSKLAAGLFLGLIIVVLVVQNWALVLDDGPRFAPAFIVLNLAALATGYGVARLVRLRVVQSFTIAIETGLQNSTLAITIAISVLDDNTLAIIPGLYGVWMLVTGFAAAGLLVRWRRHHPAPPGVHRDA